MTSGTKRTETSKTLSDLETWIASAEGQRYSCTRQYPHPGYACDRHSQCVGCLMVAAALELRRPGNETIEQRTLQPQVADAKLTLEVALKEAERCRRYSDPVLNEQVIVVLADALHAQKANDRHSGRPTIWVCNPCGGEHAQKVTACTRCGSPNIRPAQGMAAKAPDPPGSYRDATGELVLPSSNGDER